MASSASLKRMIRSSCIKLGIDWLMGLNPFITSGKFSSIVDSGAVMYLRFSKIVRES